MVSNTLIFAEETERRKRRTMKAADPSWSSQGLSLERSGLVNVYATHRNWRRASVLFHETDRTLTRRLSQGGKQTNLTLPRQNILKSTQHSKAQETQIISTKPLFCNGRTVSLMGNPASIQPLVKQEKNQRTNPKGAERHRTKVSLFVRRSSNPKASCPGEGR